MENDRKSPLSVRQGGIELKVYRIGGTPDIKQIHRPEEDPNTLKGIHTHFTYEIFFVTQGTLKLVTEDFTNTYQRSVLIIPPKLKHYSFPDSEGCFCLLFSPNESRASANSGKSKKNILETAIDGIVEFPLSEDIAFYIKKLSEKSKESTAAAERDCELLTALIFNGVFEQLTSEKTGTERRKLSAEHTVLSQNRSFKHTEASRSHIGVIENFINSNLRNKITLSDVAANVYLSTKQISRIIEKEYGTSFSELVADKRMACAEMLLKNTNMKISEIAAETFPGTEAYFYTLFKMKYGISPLQYRKRLPGHF